MPAEAELGGACITIRDGSFTLRARFLHAARKDPDLIGTLETEHLALCRHLNLLHRLTLRFPERRVIGADKHDFTVLRNLIDVNLELDSVHSRPNVGFQVIKTLLVK